MRLQSWLTNCDSLTTPRRCRSMTGQVHLLWTVHLEHSPRPRSLGQDCTGVRGPATGHRRDEFSPPKAKLAVAPSMRRPFVDRSSYDVVPPPRAGSSELGRT